MVVKVARRRYETLIQIIPAATGLKARTLSDSGNQIITPVIALGLTNKGTVWFLIIGDDGQATRASEVFHD